MANKSLTSIEKQIIKHQNTYLYHQKKAAEMLESIKLLEEEKEKAQIGMVLDVLKSSNKSIDDLVKFLNS